MTIRSPSSRPIDGFCFLHPNSPVRRSPTELCLRGLDSLEEDPGVFFLPGRGGRGDPGVCPCMEGTAAVPGLPLPGGRGRVLTCSDEAGVELGAILQHGESDLQEFASDGAEGHHFGFAPLTEGLVIGPEGRVMVG